MNRLPASLVSRSNLRTEDEESYMEREDGTINPATDWEPSGVEDELLYAYWRDVGGRVYCEVRVGGGPNWPAGSKPRMIDAVRLVNVEPGDEEIVRFTNREDEFRTLSAEQAVELIEIKRKLNRLVFGQVVAGSTMFQRHYGVDVDRAVVLCATPDPAMAWVCKQHDVAVELREPYSAGGEEERNGVE